MRAPVALITSVCPPLFTTAYAPSDRVLTTQLATPFPICSRCYFRNAAPLFYRVLIYLSSRSSLATINCCYPLVCQCPAHQRGVAARCNCSACRKYARVAFLPIGSTSRIILPSGVCSPNQPEHAQNAPYLLVRRERHPNQRPLSRPRRSHKRPTRR